MLDEDEFFLVDGLYIECMRAGKTERVAKALPASASLIDAMFEPVRREYERLTGFANCHQNAVMHHRLSLYGPACTSCGKPLRTPRARHCASCGASSATGSR